MLDERRRLMKTKVRGCTGDFPARKPKETAWVPHRQINRNKKNKQAEPTEQLWTTPKWGLLYVTILKIYIS
jgi:hypothetical protein